MRNKSIKRVLPKPHRKQDNIICIIDDSGSPMIINMANVNSITAHKTLFAKPNPHVCIVWNDETWTNINMESYEDAEKIIKDVYNESRSYNYV